jgi:hypothetical protein
LPIRGRRQQADSIGHKVQKRTEKYLSDLAPDCFRRTKALVDRRRGRTKDGFKLWCTGKAGMSGLRPISDGKRQSPSAARNVDVTSSDCLLMAHRVNSLLPSNRVALGSKADNDFGTSCHRVYEYTA